jgi:alpha-N-arabinofuranosidase
VAAVNSPVQASSSNLVQNSSFEVSPEKNGWTVDSSVAGKGTLLRSTTHVHSGQFSLELEPNASNVGTTPFDYYSAILLVNADNLRGKPVYFSGWLGARGAASAILRVWTVGPGVIELRDVRQVLPNDAPEFARDVFDVPNDPAIVALAVGCFVQGTSGGAYFDDVAVTTTEPQDLVALSQQQLGPPLVASVMIAPGQQIRQIPKEIYGMNIEWGWDGQGIWNEQTQGLTPEIVQLAQEMGVAQFRFPGGILSDLYDWQTGVGPQQNRPPSILMPGGSTSSSAFGTDEALSFSSATNAGMLITVNVLSGTPQEAADWVSFVNNGSRRVDHWEIGNEEYLDFTQFVPPRPNWTADQYANTFLDFAKAMRAVDPALKLGANVEYNYSPSAFRLHPGWEDTVLRVASSQIDFLSVHNAFAPVLPVTDAGWDVRTVYSSFLAAPILIKQSLQALADKIDAIAGPDAGHINIAVTEWAPAFRIEPESRWVDHEKTLGSALYAAEALKTFVESTRVESAHAFKLSDQAALGWIGVRQQNYIAKPVAYAMEMFAKHFGPTLVDTQSSSPTYYSRSMGLIDAVKDVPYLDVVSSIDQTTGTLYVLAINKHFDLVIHAGIRLVGYSANGTGTAWTLNGTALDANTGTELPVYPGITWAQQAAEQPGGRIDDGASGEVGISSQDLPFSGSSFQYDFPAHSVTALVFPVVPNSPCTAPCQLTGSNFGRGMLSRGAIRN